SGALPLCTSTPSPKLRFPCADRAMSVISGNRLVKELEMLGIQPGDTLMMHSSLGSLGSVDGAAETVVNALLQVVGVEGTLLVPAFRDSVWGAPDAFGNTDCGTCPQRLCPSRQPGFQGVIAETIRRRRGSLRSCHPTHSWAALGPRAEQLLAGHRDSPTPCGPG